jgi:hypothetical protein
MRDRLGQLFARDAVLQRALDVKRHLVGAVERDKACDRDEAAVARRKLGAFPHVAEQHIIGVMRKGGRDICERIAGTFVGHCDLR